MTYLEHLGLACSQFFTNPFLGPFPEFKLHEVKRQSFCEVFGVEAVATPSLYLMFRAVFM